MPGDEVSKENHEILLKMQIDLNDLRRDLCNRLEKMDADFRKLEQVVYGGGVDKIGLVGQAIWNREAIEALRSSIQTRDKIAYALAGIFATLISGFLWGIFTGEILIEFVGKP